MKVAILSDSHDHIENLEKALKAIKGKVKAVIHCGDVIAPFSTKILASVNLPTYLCLGNNDEDHPGMLKKANSKFEWVHIGQQFGEIKLGDRNIAHTHYPKLGELLAKEGKYDVVFFGHTHEVITKKIGKTLLVNPGAVCGIQGVKYGKATFAIYDAKTNTAKIINIKKGGDKNGGE